MNAIKMVKDHYKRWDKILQGKGYQSFEESITVLRSEKIGDIEIVHCVVDEGMSKVEFKLKIKNGEIYNEDDCKLEDLFYAIYL